jgi:hypothetical protein
LAPPPQAVSTAGQAAAAINCNFDFINLPLMSMRIR